MVLPDNVRPESSILYLSSFILKRLKAGKSNYTLSTLFDVIQKQHDISIHDFLLCMDWLYLIDEVIVNSDGDIKLCS